MAKIRRIALFAERSPLFINVLMGLKEGFAAHGVEASVSWPPLDGRTLPAFIANFRPDAIFEINRSRNHIIDCELKIPHICWLQDFQYNGRDLIGGLGDSDFTYLMSPPDMLGVDEAELGAWSFLWPGVNVECLDNGENIPLPYSHDLSFIGHMYPPPPEKVLNAEMQAQGVNCGKFRDIYDEFIYSEHIESSFSISKIDSFIFDYFLRYGVKMGLDDIEAACRFLFYEVMLRIKDRKFVAEGMLKASSAVGFYGSAGWGQWPQFAAKYHGDLLDPWSLAQTYRATALNVHCSIWPFHFRPLDCMGCGCAVAVNRIEHPLAATLFHEAFEPGRDYIEYELEDISEAFRRALMDRQELLRVGERGRRRILDGHTYRHRAGQILKDLNGL